MTRKDYIALAQAIHHAADEGTGTRPHTLVVKVANHIANALQADNARFDRERFLEAAGVK